MFTALMRWNRAQHGSKPGWDDWHKRELDKARRHLAFCCVLYKMQVAEGRHVLHEHPWTAGSWDEKTIQHIRQIPGVRLVRGDMCMHGMVTHVDKKGGPTGPVKKAAGFLTSGWCIAEEVGKICDGTHEHVPLLGGRARDAAIYPSGLCKAVCRGVKRQKMEAQKNLATTIELNKDNNKKVLYSLAAKIIPPTHRIGINSLNESTNRMEHWIDGVHERDGGQDVRGYRPQDGRGILQKELDALHVAEGVNVAWDDVTNAYLEPDRVLAARKVEMAYFESMGVYERVPAEDIQKTGGKLIKTRWIDVNKGDSSNPNYRSRLVGKEFRTTKDDAPYAATPPLEALRYIISSAATIQNGSNGESLDRNMLMINDVSRAYFNAAATRNLYIQLPAEDPHHGKGLVGKLKVCLYGTRDAALNWAETLSAHLVRLGFTRGVGHPCVYVHKEKGIRTLVHGDDYFSSGTKKGSYYGLILN